MKVVIIGATGLVGKAIAEQAICDEKVKTIELFVRRSSGLVHPKLTETIVDFNAIETWKSHLIGDVLFSALGTTLKVAGSKAAQFQVDHDYQFEVASAASANGFTTYVLISSVNSDPKSPFFYLKMKGLLEEKISTLSFSAIHILRPGPLKGHRETSRLYEIISTKFLDCMPQVLVTAGMRPIAGDKVASAALKAGMSQVKGINILGPKMILKESC